MFNVGSTTVEWPCLSVDLLRDSLGEFRSKYPHTMYVAAGTQADRANKNKVHCLCFSRFTSLLRLQRRHLRTSLHYFQSQVSLLKLSDLSRTRVSENSDSESEDDEDETDDDPIIEVRFLP